MAPSYRYSFKKKISLNRNQRKITKNYWYENNIKDNYGFKFKIRLTSIEVPCFARCQATLK